MHKFFISFDLMKLYKFVEHFCATVIFEELLILFFLYFLYSSNWSILNYCSTLKMISILFLVTSFFILLLFVLIGCTFDEEEKSSVPTNHRPMNKVAGPKVNRSKFRTETVNNSKQTNSKSRNNCSSDGKSTNMSQTRTKNKMGGATTPFFNDDNGRANPTFESDVKTMESQPSAVKSTGSGYYAALMKQMRVKSVSQYGMPR